MSSRTYGQFCGLARALEIVGERWALLLVRDLLVGPRRFSDLRRGLPKIPTNVLSARLRELEAAGVVRRRLLARPATGFEYELTEYGGDLEQIALSLNRWGARSLGDPRDGEIVTVDSLVMALRSTFQAEAAAGVRAVFELRVDDLVVHARVDDGGVEVEAGPADPADLVVEAGSGVRALLAGELSPEDALREDVVRLDGASDADELRSRFATFTEVFRIGAAPVLTA